MRKVYVSMFMLLFTALGAEAKNYKGSEIYSSEQYLYGRFEMSIQSAPGSGQLSTFFLYRNESEQSSTLWREIDIEIFGRDSNVFQTNVIIEKIEGKTLMTEKTHKVPTNLHSSFHTYAVEWTPGQIRWYLDDLLMRTETDYAALCVEPMSIRMNHWVSSEPDWVGKFDKSVLPTYQYVDYISYSSHTPSEGDGGGDYTLQWKDDFNTISTSRWQKANWSFDQNLTDFLPANVYTEDGKLVLKLHDATPAPVAAASVTQDEFTIFPNPFSEKIIISGIASADYSLSVFSTAGTTILESIVADESAQSAISSALATSPETHFIVCLYQGTQLVQSVQIVKEVK